MREARDPFPQPGQVVGGKLRRRQQGEHIVEWHSAHRHSS
jgi:hypothetical protein